MEFKFNKDKTYSSKEKAYRFSWLAYHSATALFDGKDEGTCWLAKPSIRNNCYLLAKSNERRAKKANDWPDMDYGELFGTNSD
jgi:hypothetical protein